MKVEESKGGKHVASSMRTGAAMPVVRHRLLERLSAAPRPRLILVQGPAGFGKTSLLRQHCERRAALGEAVGWIRMDNQAADGSHFLRLLFDTVGELDDSQAKGLERPTTLQDVFRLFRAIERPVVLVVDNFETADAPDFEAVFAQLVRGLPETVQLCVGTRVIPSARLARLHLLDGTLSISNEELCFRPAETMEFFSEFNSLRPVEITDIHERTDGWPAALQAFRLCLRRGGRFRSDAWTGRGISRELMDFLAAEMFENLPPAMGTLLLELAIPEKLSPELVEHITGEGRGAERLAEIERAGLFLNQADLDGSWLRFHNLFRQFLLNRAQALHGENELRRRNARIAEWHAANGYNEAAITHWIAAGETERAADKVACIVDTLVAQERLGLIETYADQLPTESILRHDNLVHGVVIAYSFRRAFEKSEQLLNAHREKLEREGAGLSERGMHEFSRLFLLAAQDRIEELGTAGARTAEMLQDQDGFSYGVTFNARGVLLVGQGEFDAARGLMLKARPLHDRAGSQFGQGYQHAIYAMSLMGQGRTLDATRSLESALRDSEKDTGGSVFAGSVTAAYLTSNLYELNRSEDAAHLIAEYGALAEQQAIADSVATMMQTSARLCEQRGEYGEAEVYLERLLYLGHRHSLDRLVTYAQAEFARQATLAGDADRAERWLRELPADCRESPGMGLLFHAGEAEAHTVTWARWLILCERYAEARKLLTEETRRAAASGRRRREMKLQIMSALLRQAEQKPAAAGRHMICALEIAAGGNFIRSFLDEGEPVLTVLTQLKAARASSAPELESDPVMDQLQLLLNSAGNVSSQDATYEMDASTLVTKLTARERKLLRYAASGLSNKELADRLCVSTNTIKWHMRNIFGKLQIKNRVQAIAMAHQQGLLK